MPLLLEIPTVKDHLTEAHGHTGGELRVSVVWGQEVLS